MTNTEKLAWLNDMNAHLAAGGKLEYKLTDSTWTSEYGTNPQWHSDPINWRKVPLPRKATNGQCDERITDELQTQQ